VYCKNPICGVFEKFLYFYGESADEPLMKNMLKTFAITLGSLLLLVILLFVSLFYAIQQEGFQNKIKDIVLPYLEEKLQTRVQLERISVRFPDKIVLQGVVIEDLQQDTLLAMQELVVDINMRRLLSSELVVHHIGLEGLRAIVYRISPERYNFDFLVDAFVSPEPPDSVEEDSSSLNLKIELNTLIFRDVHLRFSDDSLMHVVAQWDQLDMQIAELDLYRERYGLKLIDLQGATLDLRMPGAKVVKKGFNPEHIRLKRLNGKLKDVVYHPDTMAAVLESLSFSEQSGLTLNQLSMNVLLDAHQLRVEDFYLRTPHSKLQNLTILRFDSIGQLSSDLSKINITTRLNKSFLGLRDVQLLMPDLSVGEGMRLPPVIKADLDFKGTIDCFKANFKVDSDLAGLKAMVDMTSVNPDAPAGSIDIADMYFYSDSFNMELEKVSLLAVAQGRQNRLDVDFPFATLRLEGDYKLTQLGNVINNLMVKHFNVSNARYLPEANQQFKLGLKVWEHSFLKPFLPDSLWFDPLNLQIRYRSKGKNLELQADIPSVQLGALQLSELSLQMLTAGDALTYSVGLQEVRQGDLEAPPLSLTGKLLNDVADFSLLMRDTVNKEENRVSGTINLGSFKKDLSRQRSSIEMGNLPTDGLSEKQMAVSSGSISSQSPLVPPLNLALTIDRLALKSLEPFAADYIAHTSGFFSGTVNIDDVMGAMKITGSLNVNDIALKILMLDETFTMPLDEIQLQEDAVVFNDFDIMDEKGEKLTIDGQIGFHQFQDFKFDLTVRTDNFRALNSGAGTNDLFFGDLFLGLDLKITGDLDLPVVSGRLQVNDKSKLTFIVPQTDPTLTDRTGIVEFVTPGKDVNTSEPLVAHSLKQSNINGMDVGVDIAIDKNAELTMIIDKVTGDYVKLKGEALLSGGIDPSGKISLTGRYELSEGMYELNVSLIQRKFAIRKGSYILWTGDPLSALMDITAEYETRTAPLSLVESSLGAASQETRNRFLQRMPFVTELKVTGELMEPQVSFDIVINDEDLQISPEVLSTTNAQLARLRTEPAELYKQVFALLLFNQFLAENPLNSSSGGSTDLMIRESAGRIISQQLNQLAGNLVKGFELEFDVDAIDDYSTGVRESRTDLNVALSKQFFDNRLKITVGSSFGLEGTPYENQSSTNIAGNFKADYLITRDGRYRLRAYRKNEYQMALLGEVIETGLTFMITMDYDTWSELISKSHQ
jgi:hypothetical protein